MDNDAVVKKIVNSLREDILRNKEFMKDLMKDFIVTEKNIDPQLIKRFMATTPVPPPKPIDNTPFIRTGTQRPIVIKSGEDESRIIWDLLEGNNVYLYGKAGTGKTHIAKAIGDIMGLPVYQINCSQWTSPVEIRGGQTIKGYVEGELIKAWGNGGLLILDELPKLDPNTAGLLNEALADTAMQPIESVVEQEIDGKTVAVAEYKVPAIRNGRGQNIEKGQFLPKDHPNKYRFCVIATGNTDMMTVANKYSGNQRQDYSLVDRFAGSYYKIDVNPEVEIALNYNYVYVLCNSIRKVLDSGDYLQSISLRTMLNFNRTYEQQMLVEIGSKYADKVYGSQLDANGNPLLTKPKTVGDSLRSFLDMLDPALKTKIETNAEFKAAKGNVDAVKQEDFYNTQDIILFQKEFHKKYGVWAKKEIKD